MSAAEWTLKTATELAQAIQEKKVTSLALVNAYIDRVHALDRGDGGINAVVLIYEEEARALAREKDKMLEEEGKTSGPLHGVPMTIKECNFYGSTAITQGDPKDVDPTCANTIAGGFNEPFVERLVNAGAIIFGKTNLPLHQADWQSYNDVYGQTNNPFDIGKSPGGSSGGSSAALAACLTALDFGGDIGGSIRVPAHFCGLFGHKPTYGVIPKLAVKTLPDLANMDLVKLLPEGDISVRGPLARSAADLKLVMEITTDYASDLPQPKEKALSEYTVGFITSLDICPTSKETQKAVTQLAEKLAAAGAKVEVDTVQLPFDPDEMMRVYLKLLGCTLLAEPAMMATPAYGMDGASLQKTLKEDAAKYDASDNSLEALAARAPFLSYGEWKKTNHRRHELRTLWSTFFKEKYDFLICPIFARSAFDHDHSGTNLLPFWRETGRSMDIDGTKGNYQRHVFWSALTGTCFLPSTAIPTGLGDDTKMPIGLQIVGPEKADFACIEFARLLETQLGYRWTPPANKFGTAV